MAPLAQDAADGNMRPCVGVVGRPDADSAQNTREKRSEAPLVPVLSVLASSQKERSLRYT